MGMSAEAHLAYGYDLGSAEDFKAAERGEYGYPNLPWFNADDDESEDEVDFADEVEKRLLAMVGFTETDWRAEGYFDRQREALKRAGVRVVHSGHADYCGWMLVATDSDRSVEWAEAMVLDPSEITNSPAYHGWDMRLADALAALGITPHQHSAKWLVFPTYG